MITNRLQMILNHINGQSVADIGTDHAYIPIALSEKGIKVIATDIKSGPLEMAKANISKNNTKIELRLGAGLSPISVGETDNIVIAGMGGEMIIKIIKADEEKARKSLLLLQPMNSQYELRQFLLKNNFNILEEDLAVEGFKVYNLIIAQSGESKPYCNYIDYHLPPILYKNKYFNNLVEKKKREFTRIYNGLTACTIKNDNQIQKTKNTLDEIIKLERMQQDETL